MSFNGTKDHIVGYAYNADSFCEDCTRAYAFERFIQIMERARGVELIRMKELAKFDAWNMYSESLEEHLMDTIANLDIDILLASVYDEEMNDIHPIHFMEEAIDVTRVCGNFEYHMDKDREPYIIKEANYISQDLINELFEELTIRSLGPESGELIIEVTDRLYDLLKDQQEDTFLKETMWEKLQKKVNGFIYDANNSNEINEFVFYETKTKYFSKLILVLYGN